MLTDRKGDDLAQRECSGGNWTLGNSFSGKTPCPAYFLCVPGKPLLAKIRILSGSAHRTLSKDDEDEGGRDKIHSWACYALLHFLCCLGKQFLFGNLRLHRKNCFCPIYSASRAIYKFGMGSKRFYFFKFLNFQSILGSKFCVLVATGPKVTPMIYRIDKGKPAPQLMGKVEPATNLNSALWAPQGGWVVVMGLNTSTGTVCFVDATGTEVNRTKVVEHTSLSQVRANSQPESVNCLRVVGTRQVATLSPALSGERAATKPDTECTPFKDVNCSDGPSILCSASSGVHVRRCN